MLWLLWESVAVVVEEEILHSLKGRLANATVFHTTECLKKIPVSTGYFIDYKSFMVKDALFRRRV